MQNVGTPAPNGNAPIDDVLAWIAAMGDKGLYKLETARQRQTSLRELVTVLGPDENHGAKWVLDNIDQIAQRWCTKKNANPGTRDAYKSKARVALGDFFDFQRGDFRGRGRQMNVGEGKERKAKLAPGAAVVPAMDVTLPPTLIAPPPPPASDKNVSQGPERSLPLSDARELRFSLPSQWTVADSFRSFFHFLTLAGDFDPMNSQHAAIFSMVRRSIDEK